MTARRPAPIKLTSVPYVPGKTDRPSQELFEGAVADLDEVGGTDGLWRSLSFVSGLQAGMDGYFWEAHEFWEPVWMRLPVGAGDRLALQALIQLANAGLKVEMDRPKASERLLALAEGLMAEAEERMDQERFKFIH